MFFQSPKLPDELILNILNRLPLKDAINFLYVSKEMNAFIKDDGVWRKFGAKNFVDFITRLKKLPKEDQRHILNEKYSLKIAEDILHIVSLAGNERLKKILPEEEIATIPQTCMSHLCTAHGIRALLEKLITLKQAAAFNHPTSLHWLLSDGGLSALREGLFTIEQAIIASNNSRDLLARIVSPHGLILLREKILTFEQAAAMDDIKLMHLTGKEGLLALQEKLITIQEVMQTNNLEELIRTKLSGRKIEPDELRPKK